MKRYVPTKTVAKLLLILACLVAGSELTLAQCLLTPTSVTVTGIKAPFTNVVNGVYQPSGTFNGVFQWAGPNGRLILWRNNRWELVVPVTTDTGYEIHAYSTAGSSTNLPCSGWVNGSTTNDYGSPTLSGGCGVLTGPPPSVSIAASGSLTLFSGQRITLTASGATSYIWSTGQSTASAAVSPVSSSVISVTGITNNCSSTATIALTVLPARAGLDWTSRSSAVDNNWSSVAYGNNLFVAVANSGGTNRVMTSSDGASWTVRTTPNNNNWNSVAFGNGLFVAVANTGTGNRVMTSTNGTDWTAQTSIVNNTWTSVTFGNNKFVAVAQSGSGNRVMTSTDGSSWTTQSSAADNNWRSVTFGNNTFVAVATTGTGNRVMTSTDGNTWTIRNTPANNIWTSVTYGNGLFVAVAASGTGDRIMTSPDGVTWTLRNSPADNNWTSVTYGNGQFVAVASSGTGNRAMQSLDGITWTAGNTPVDNDWNAVTFANNMFVAVSGTGTGNRVMTSGTFSTCTPLNVSISAVPSLTVSRGTSVTLTATGGTDYVWSTGATTDAISFSASQAGTTNLTVWGTTGNCTGIGSASVSVTCTTPVVSLANTSSGSCVGVASLSVSSDQEISRIDWLNGATIINSQLAQNGTISAVLSPTAVGSYVARVTNTDGCSIATNAVVITAAPAAAIAAAPSLTIIAGSSVTLTASGGNSYLWSTSDAAPSITVNPSTSTFYSVSAIANGCVSVRTEKVTVKAPACVLVTTSCGSFGGEYTQSGTVQNRPALTDAETNRIEYYQSSNDPVYPTGWYLMDKDYASAYYNPSTATTVPTSGWVPFSADNISCPAAITVGSCSLINCVPPSMTISSAQGLTVGTGATVLLTVDGAESYTWTTGAMSSSINITVTSTTVISVSGLIESAGCIGVTSVTITVDPCQFVPKSVTVSGAGTAGVNAVYAPGTALNPPVWSNAGSLNIKWSGTSQRWEIADKQSGTVSYTAAGGSASLLPCSGWTGVNGNSGNPVLTGGCGPLSMPPVQITVLPSLTVSVGSTVTLTASGASTYQWSNGRTTASITAVPLSATTLSVTGVSGGCSATASAALSLLPQPPTISQGSCITVTTTCGNFGGVYYLRSDTYNGKAIYMDDDGNYIYYYLFNSNAPQYPQGWYFTDIDDMASYYNSAATATPPVTGWKPYTGDIYSCTGPVTLAEQPCPAKTLCMTVTTSCLNDYGNSFGGTYTQDDMIYGRPSLTDEDGNFIYFYKNSGVRDTFLTGWYLEDPDQYIAFFNPSTSGTPPTSGWVPYTDDGYFCNSNIKVANCTSTSPCTTTLALTISALPSLTIASGSSVTLTASGADSYTWSTPANTTSIAVTPAQTTVYSVSGTNASGCVGQASATVSVTCAVLPAQAPQPVNIGVLSASNCPMSLQLTMTGTNAVLKGPGGYLSSTVKKAPGGTFPITASGIKQPGTYSYTVSSTSTCGLISTQTITFEITGTGCN